MPYQGETASKTSQVATLRDPNVEAALSTYRTSGESLIAPASIDSLVRPLTDLDRLPITSVGACIAIDGSRQLTPVADVDGQQTTVGFLRVGVVGIDLVGMRELSAERFIDPVRLAKTIAGETISYPLPGAGMCAVDSVGTRLNIADSWRLACDQMLASCGVEGYSLADALLRLYGDPDDETTELAVPTCPVCLAFAPSGGSIGNVGRDGGGCESCGGQLRLVDALGVDDMLATYGRENALNMLMDMVERLALVAVIENLRRNDPADLGRTIIVADGPLSAIRAIQRIVKPMQTYLDGVAVELEAAGLPPMLLVGVEKSGQFIEHANTIGHLIEPGHVMALSSEYIGKYITGRTAQRGSYGANHMYGRRFFYRRTDGHLIVLTVPARAGVASWSAHPDSEKFESYPALGTILGLLDELKSSQFPGAILPLTFAHQHASLALSASDALARMSQSALGIAQNTRLRVTKAW